MGEQDRPLSPATLGNSSEENSNFLAHSKRRSGIICCRCCAATTLVIGIVILILAFTVFKVKEPEITLNSVTINGLNFALRQGNPPRPGLNMSYITDISIKNPNSASFKFSNATTLMYYSGVVIGEARNPPRNARAHKTINLNVTVDVMVDSVTSNISRLASDIVLGEMPIETYTDMVGRMNVMNIVKKHVEVKMNCRMIVMLSTETIKDKVCKKIVRM